MQPCLNCEHPAPNNAKFCPACGQKTATHRLTLKDVLHDGFHYFTHADKGLMHLLKALLRKPGIVAREFVEGKRKKYYPPLNFFLVAAAIYLFMSTMLNRFEQLNRSSDTNIAAQASHLSSKDQLEKEKKAQVIKIVTERKTKALLFITHHSNWIAMFAAPFISLIVWLMYRKSGFNYTEHLTANLYLIGVTNLFNCLILMPANTLVSMQYKSAGVGAVFGTVFALTEIIYRSVFYYQFINQPAKQTKTKTVIKSIIAVASWIIFTFACVGLYIIAGFVGMKS